MLSFGVVLALIGAVDAEADTGAVVYKGARILTAAGPAIENGILVVQGEKIVAIGKEGELPLPDRATVRDLSGKTIIPGLVDTHSHIGIYPRPAVPANSDGNESTG